MSWFEVEGMLPLQRLCRRFLGLLTLLLVGFCTSTPSRADNLSVGFADLDFYPYGKPSADQIYVGYLRALLDAFAEDHDHDLDFAGTPMKRLLQEFERGEIDLFVPDNPGWSQQYKEGIDLYYSDTVAVALDGFAVLAGREGEVVGDEIRNIGVILGFTVEPLFDQEDLKQISFDRASKFESIFRALFLERVDAVYCNLAAANHVLSALGKDSDSVAWDSQLPKFKSEFKISSTHLALIEEFNVWMLSHQGLIVGLKEEFGILEGEQKPWGAE
jgi:hypothetical protein